MSSCLCEKERECFSARAHLCLVTATVTCVTQRRVLVLAAGAATAEREWGSPERRVRAAALARDALCLKLRSLVRGAEGEREGRAGRTRGVARAAGGASARGRGRGRGKGREAVLGLARARQRATGPLQAVARECAARACMEWMEGLQCVALRPFPLVLTEESSVSAVALKCNAWMPPWTRPAWHGRVQVWGSYPCLLLAMKNITDNNNMKNEGFQ